jgi:hypothetical protein
MIKRTVTALALVLTVACASSPLTSSSNESAGGGVASTSLKNAPDYILLSAPTQVRTYDFANAIGVRGLHVRGTMTNVGFIPVGDIQGGGKMCADGRDWLSLRDLTVNTASSGKTPTAPYVLGCATASGFQPASRTIVAQ